MATFTAEQARNTTVFVINNYKNEIEETSLFDHIMKSAEKTTSSRGVEHKLYFNEGEDKEGNLVWFLKEWKPGGKSQIIDKFPTEEAAEEEKFQRIWKYDFMTDDQRDTMYWSTKKEAHIEFITKVLSNNTGKCADVTTNDGDEATGIITEKNNELFVSVGHNGEVAISIDQISSIDNIEE